MTLAGVNICFSSICQDLSHSFSSQTWCYRGGLNERIIHRRRLALPSPSLLRYFCILEGMMYVALYNSSTKVLWDVKRFGREPFRLDSPSINTTHFWGKSKVLDIYLFSLPKQEFLKNVRQKMLAISFQSFSKILRIELLPLGFVKWSEAFNFKLFLC